MFTKTIIQPNHNLFKNAFEATVRSVTKSLWVYRRAWKRRRLWKWGWMFTSGVDVARLCKKHSDFTWPDTWSGVGRLSVFLSTLLRRAPGSCNFVGALVLMLRGFLSTALRRRYGQSCCVWAQLDVSNKRLLGQNS